MRYTIIISIWVFAFSSVNATEPPAAHTQVSASVSGDSRANVSPHDSGCRVQQDDGRYYIDTSVPNCQSYYDKRHPCAQDGRPTVCSRQDMFRAIDRRDVDMIINSHRGVWGLKLSDGAAQAKAFGVTSLEGAPENSLGGLRAAYSASFPTTEFDVFLMRSTLKSDYDGRGMVSHFTDLNGFSNYPVSQIVERGNERGFLMTEIPDTEYIRRTSLKDRNHHLVPKEGFQSLYSFLDTMKNEMPSMLIVLDLKFQKPLKRKANAVIVGGKDASTSQCLAFCESSDLKLEIQRLLQDISDDAFETGTEANLIIKIPQQFGGAREIINMIGDVNFVRLQWAPQPDLSDNTTKDAVLQYMDEWMAEAPNSVAFWDTTIPSKAHWSGDVFTYKNKSYADITDYAVTATNRRPAIWTPDPAGPGGRHGNYAMSWEQYGNTPETETSSGDTRGDAFYGLTYRYSANAVVTTDRPDIFLCLRNYMKSSAVFYCDPWERR